MPLAKSGKTLPNELRKRIHQYLFNDGSYGTLANCAEVSKSFGVSAVEELYSCTMSLSYVKTFGYRALAKYWRSLLMSILDGATYYPYCEFVKTFEVFTVSVQFELLRRFPRGGFPVIGLVLKAPLLELGVPWDWTEITPKDPDATLRNILTWYFSGCSGLRAITGFVDLQTFALCRHSLQHLQHVSIEVDPSAPLATDPERFAQGLGGHNTPLNAIYLRSKENDRTHLVQDRADPYDDHLGKCLSSLVSSAAHLRELSLIGYDDFNIGEQLYGQVALHAKSLTILRLSLSLRAFYLLPRLSACTQLKELELRSRQLWGPSFDDPDSDSSPGLPDFPQRLCDEMISWLSTCYQLTELNIHRFFTSPRLFVPLLSAGRIRLSRLEVHCSSHESHPLDFPSALVSILQGQPQLSILHLSVPRGLDWNIFQSTICSLRSLTRFKLEGVGESFRLAELSQLLSALDQLTHLEFGPGFIFRSPLFAALSSIRRAQVIRISCSFGVDHSQILAFSRRLPVDCRGVHLYLTYVHSDGSTATPGLVDMIICGFGEVPRRFAENCGGRLTFENGGTLGLDY